MPLKNGQTFRQLLLKPLPKFGSKIRKIFLTQTFGLDQILFCFVSFVTKFFFSAQISVTYSLMSYFPPPPLPLRGTWVSKNRWTSCIKLLMLFPFHYYATKTFLYFLSFSCCCISFISNLLTDTFCSSSLSILFCWALANQMETLTRVE
jgi:hypothetical protein